MSFLSKIKKIMRQRRKYRQICVDNDVQIATTDIARIVFDIQGKHNTIKIGKLRKLSGKIRISIAGNNNSLVIDDGFGISGELRITIGQIHPNFGSVENVLLQIGANTSMEGCNITTYNSHAKIIIGANCMFSSNINLYHTDGHPIFDAQTHKIINHVKTMHIGNHVWVGANATVLKNVTIPDGAIVGLGAVVSKYRYDIQDAATAGGIVLSGNPARVVRSGVLWSPDGSSGYVQNNWEI